MTKKWIKIFIRFIEVCENVFNKWIKKGPSSNWIQVILKNSLLRFWSSLNNLKVDQKWNCMHMCHMTNIDLDQKLIPNVHESYEASWTFFITWWSRVWQFDVTKIKTYTKNAYKTFICTQFKSTRFDVFDLKIRIWSRKFFFES